MAQSQTLRFESALVNGKWQNNPTIVVRDGIIESISTSDNSKAACDLELVALPGMPNIHSHSFQRSFAGLSEYRTGETDSFWTWRELMYRFLDALQPEDLLTIARQLYLEMLSAGYTWVGEFHYIHHLVESQLSSGSIESSNRHEAGFENSRFLIEAASETGIGLCLLPVLYQRGGLDGAPMSGNQQRFGLSNNEFLKLLDFCRAQQRPEFKTGIAFHSLRGVSIENAKEVLKLIGQDAAQMPVHIHVAEQIKEVEDCLKFHRYRPVEMLMDQLPVGPNWCLIHATHMNDSEVSSVASSDAVVGLCPTTEANLGDGFFSAPLFQEFEGRISIGSDSHCAIDFRDELRMLEYGQRLNSQQRAILGNSEQSVGRYLYQSAAEGGAAALGINAGSIEVGKRADFTLVDPNHPSIAGIQGDRILDRLIFCNIGNPVSGAVVGGEIFLTESESFQRKIAESSKAFLAMMDRLQNESGQN